MKLKFLSMDLLIYRAKIRSKVIPNNIHKNKRMSWKLTRYSYKASFHKTILLEHTSYQNKHNAQIQGK